MKSIDREDERRSSGIWGVFLVGPGFLLAACWFLWGPDYTEIPATPPKSFHESMLSTEPLRTPLGDPPIILIDGFDRSCMDCHKLFPARHDPPEKLFQHEHIRIEHGINDRCRNCHDVYDRDRLVLQNGQPIPYTEVTRLCADCHGPTYRDWERGMHGRTNGYWDAERGPLDRLGCTECHDPHQPRLPAMAQIKPLPPPETLRMGVHGAHAHGEGEESDPLRRAILKADEQRAAQQVEEEY